MEARVEDISIGTAKCELGHEWATRVVQTSAPEQQETLVFDPGLCPECNAQFVVVVGRDM